MNESSKPGTSLVVQWLSVHDAPNAGGPNLTDPWSRNLTPHAATKTQQSQINKYKFLKM